MSKTWFITGTSSGLGRLLTEQLLARGDRVAATLRRPEALDERGRLLLRLPDGTLQTITAGDVFPVAASEQN